MQNNFCFGRPAGCAQNIADTHLPPYLQKLLQGWVNRLRPYSNSHCYACSIVSNAILSLGFIRGSCSTHHFQLCELINNSVKAGPKHKGSWFSYQACCSPDFLANTPYRSITVIMIDLCPCFTITVMTFINVLRWSNCPGRAGLSWHIALIGLNNLH